MIKTLMAAFGINVARHQRHVNHIAQRQPNQLPPENLWLERQTQYAKHDYKNVNVVNWKQTVDELMHDFVIGDAKYVDFLMEKYPDKLSGGAFHKVFGNKKNPTVGILKIFTFGDNGVFGETEGANAIAHVYLQTKGIVPPKTDRPAILGKNVYVTSTYLPFRSSTLPKIKTFSPLTFENPTINQRFNKLLTSMQRIQTDFGLYFRDSLFPTTQGNAYVDNEFNYGALNVNGQIHFYISDVDGVGIDINNQATLQEFDIDNHLQELASPLETRWTPEDVKSSLANLEIMPDGLYANSTASGGKQNKSRKSKTQQRRTKRRFK